MNLIYVCHYLCIDIQIQFSEARAILCIGRQGQVSMWVGGEREKEGEERDSRTTEDWVGMMEGFPYVSVGLNAKCYLNALH